MSKILRIQSRFIIMSYKLIYQFPSIIVGGFLEATVTILSFFIFWQVVLIGQAFKNWLLPDILIFSALGYLCWGIASFFFTGIWAMPQKIIEGEIERWLCRPLRHPLLGILFEEVWVGGGAFFCVSTILLIMVSLYYKIRYSFLNILIAFIILIFGMFCLYLLYGTVSSLTGFLIGRANFIQQAFDSLEDNFVRIPATTLPGGIKGILIFGYPVAFISAFPAEVLLQHVDLIVAIGILLFQIPLTLFWLIAFLLVWRFGRQRYESASN
ncbi:MAG: ABC-2 family transporter protein [Candidatus Thorarchaeota archaeon]